MTSMDKDLMREYQRDYRVTHSQLTVTLPTQLVTAFKMKLKRDNLTYAEFIRRAIAAYLSGSGDDKDGK